jgi:hypothetical protein
MAKFWQNPGNFLCKLQILFCSLEEDTVSYFSLVSAKIYYKIKPVIGSNISESSEFTLHWLYSRLSYKSSIAGKLKVLGFFSLEFKKLEKSHTVEHGAQKGK